MSHRRPIDPGSCSGRVDAAGLSAYGTAAAAHAWVALEQPGPWGRTAATQSHLDPELAAAIESAVASASGRLVLVRAPGPHPDAATTRTPLGSARPGDSRSDAREQEGDRRTVLVAWSGPSPWLLRGRVDDPADLLTLDWAALGAGDEQRVRAGAGWLSPDPLGAVLVCTNGRRDRCCAIRGRPVALDAGRARPGRVWEGSHLGGHRFAPTALVLPVGRLFGRLDAAGVVAAVDAAAEARLPAELLGPRHDRGVGRLPAPAQVAESAVRAGTGETAWGRLQVDEPRSALARPPAGGDRWEVPVRHTDGRRWTVHVTRRPGPALSDSCGKPPVVQPLWHTDISGSPIGSAG